MICSHQQVTEQSVQNKRGHGKQDTDSEQSKVLKPPIPKMLGQEIRVTSIALSFKEILMGWYKNLTSAQKTTSVEFHA
jgi:hypothetical protein